MKSIYETNLFKEQFHSTLQVYNPSTSKRGSVGSGPFSTTTNISKKKKNKKSPSPPQQHFSNLNGVVDELPETNQTIEEMSPIVGNHNPNITIGMPPTSTSPKVKKLPPVTTQSNKNTFASLGLGAS